MASLVLELGEDDRSIALQQIWDRAMLELVKRVSTLSFESYLRTARPVSLTEDEFVLGVSSAFARQWLERRCIPDISAAVSGVAGREVVVQLVTLTGADRAAAPTRRETATSPRPAAPTEPAPAPAPALTPPAHTRSQRTSASAGITELPRNPRHTFDTFVIGRSNRLAQAGAEAAANGPGGAYNPLFIYGNSGLGKTHLLHAIANHIEGGDTGLRVALVDGESFTHAYVTALRERKTEEFRRHFRGVDVWLVDDIQFIAGREQTKEEFFHTFNALYQTGRQIVIACDRVPRELRDMDERLLTRFECGLIADINPPDLETRVAILEQHCIANCLEVPRDVVYQIAGAIQSNMRALEGAITKIVAYSSIMRAPITRDLAQEVLGEFFLTNASSRRTHKGINIPTLLEAVSERFNLDVEVIVGRRRDHAALMARHIAFYLAREITELSLSQIGAEFGGRDHTTVQRGAARVEGDLASDPVLRKMLQEIRAGLTL